MKTYTNTVGYEGYATFRNEGLEKFAGYAKRVARVAARVGLFLVAPLIGLAYAAAFPFVGVGVLAWHAARAVAKR